MRARYAPSMLALLLLASAAHASDAVRSEAFMKQPLVGWPLLEVRGGLDASTMGPHPVICAEVSPHKYVAVEACGTGAGFLYPSAQDEMAHFRAEASVPVLDQGRTDLTLQVGIGFAEIQVGEDTPGFLFGPAQSADQRAGAGAEASGSLKARAWVHERVYLTGELSGGAACIPSAPTVLESSGPVVPFGMLTVGAGF